MLTPAINILAAFIHTEPTSLTLLQEMQLPQTLFATLEKGVPRSFEVRIQTYPADVRLCLPFPMLSVQSASTKTA